MKQKTMLDYVRESSGMIMGNINRAEELTGVLVREYRQGGYEDIVIVASGSSYNAAACARLFMQKVLGCRVILISPFQFVHAENEVKEKELVIAVSQSGYSRNTIEALDLIREKGRKAIALTGDMNSDIRDHADLLLDFGAGTETVGYVTKGVCALTLYLILFALGAAVETGKLSQEGKADWESQICRIPSIHCQVQEKFEAYFEQYLDIFTSMQHVYVCACGSSLGTGMEAALKIGETIQVPAFCYELEEYIHGPNLQLTPNYTVIFIDGGCASERVREIFEDTRIVTKRAILVTNDGSRGGSGVCSMEFAISEELTPLCILPFFQMLSYKVTDVLARWSKHPLQLIMKEKVSAKTENYKNSPLKTDMPS